MYFRRSIHFLLIICISCLFSCKAKKCPNFESDGANRHVKYDKNGLVKKKNKSQNRSWDDY
jgi:hypothetical protein